jgi:hypothetical protein
MLLSLDDYRRQLRSTFDAVMRAEATTFEAEKEPSVGGEILETNRRYRRARERERARRAAKWFSS